jgi:hypothetical protein
MIYFLLLTKIAGKLILLHIFTNILVSFFSFSNLSYSSQIEGVMWELIVHMCLNFHLVSYSLNKAKMDSVEHIIP